MEEIKVCPYCKEHNVEKYGFGPYHCNACDREFDVYEYNHEILRQKISCVCSGEEATEENPIDLTINDEVILLNNDIDVEEGGRFLGVFQDDEGIVWFNVEGYDEPIEAEDLITSDMEHIFNLLEKNYGSVTATDFFWLYTRN